MTWPGIEPTTSCTPGERSTTKPLGAVEVIDNDSESDTDVSVPVSRSLTDPEVLSLFNNDARDSDFEDLTSVHKADPKPQES